VRFNKDAAKGSSGGDDRTAALASRGRIVHELLSANQNDETKWTKEARNSEQSAGERNCGTVPFVIGVSASATDKRGSSIMAIDKKVFTVHVVWAGLLMSRIAFTATPEADAKASRQVGHLHAACRRTSQHRRRPASPGRTCSR